MSLSSGITNDIPIIMARAIKKTTSMGSRFTILAFVSSCHFGHFEVHHRWRHVSWTIKKQVSLFDARHLCSLLTLVMYSVYMYSKCVVCMDYRGRKVATIYLFYEVFYRYAMKSRD